MGRKDARIDAHIAGAADFAKPILKELRKRIHAACPGVEETIKWRMPFFEYGGKLFAGMSAFKRHCSFGFWHPMMRGGDTSLEGIDRFGKLESVASLPSAKAFEKLAKQAMKLVDDGVKPLPRTKRADKKEIAVPPGLAAALKKNPRARATFAAFAYGKREEYVRWIAQAKREETRSKRIEAALSQLAEGKALYWKYETR